MEAAVAKFGQDAALASERPFSHAVRCVTLYRIRHIKCDETRPICERCSSTGRVCDGYEVPSNHRFLSRLSQAREREATAKAKRISYILPKALEPGRFPDANSWNAFHNFRDSTSLQLITATRTRLWEDLVPQLSHSDEAVRSGLLALGAMTQRFQIHGVQTSRIPEARELDDQAAKHYYQGIYHLRNRLLNKPEGEERSLNSLVPCLLFVFYEFLQGNEAGAIAHLRSGLAIERDIMSRRGASPASKLDEQVCIMLRIMEMALSIWLDIDPRTLKPNGSLYFETLFREPEMPIDDFDTPGVRWNKLSNSIHTLRAHFPGGTASPSQRERQKMLRSQLEILLADIADLQAATPPSNPIRLRRLDVTTLNVRMSQLALGAALEPRREVYFATKTHDFHNILKIATPLLRPINLLESTDLLYSARNAEPALRERGLLSLFWFAGGAIQPLFFVAVNCTDKAINEKAIDLLLTDKGWREGASDSIAMAKIARNRLKERGISMASVEAALEDI